MRCLLFVREASKNVTPELYEKILKRAYLSFSANVKEVTWRTYDSVAFLINGLAEIFSVDSEISYTITFGLLKSLAEKIKKLQTENNKLKMTKVYNFKVLNTFRFISQLVILISAFSCELTTQIKNQEKIDSNTPFKFLLHPLISIIHLYNVLYPSTSYIPLRLHILGLIINIKRNFGIKIPILNHFLMLLRSKQFLLPLRHAQKGDNVVDFDLDLSIKLGK